MSHRRDRYPTLLEPLEVRRLLCTSHFGDARAMEELSASQVAEARQSSPTVTNTPSFIRRINFQPDGSNPVPDFYRVDTGAPYGLRSNGLTYGWSADNRDGRDRNVLDDQRYDTFHHLQKNGANYSWEMLVPNGTYTVRVVVGDPSYHDSVYRVNVEGQLAVNFTPSAGNRFGEGTVTVTVNDERLTVSNAAGAVNNKIAFLEICGGGAPLPVVSLTASD
ncbi:MAG: hypothetical protein NZ561_09580, partial [Phycisphaerae bacterium]|nr:hypothetical protein [Phycisphaerae bacterium]MDW8261444.1 hypothetical protein [Phycisphaerales bacterium]